MTSAEVALARRYAQALFEAARSRGLEEKVGEDLAGVRRVAEEDPALLGFLTSPEIRDRDKIALVDSVFGSKVELLISRFLALVVDHKRGGLLPEMGKAYADLLEEHHGVLRIQVKTARPLRDDEAARLREALARRTGRDVVLEPEVDPEILGGVLTRLRDRVIDGSVRRQLEEMREAMLAARL